MNKKIKVHLKIHERHSYDQYLEVKSYNSVCTLSNSTLDQ